MKLPNVVRLGVTLSLVVASLPTQGRGQVVPSPYRFIDSRQEAGPFLAFVAPGKGRFGYGPKPGLALGGRYGIHLGGPIGAEGVVLFFPTNRDLVDPGRVEGDRVVGEVSSNLLLLDGRLRLSLTGDRTWKGLNPIIFAGGGVAFDLAGESSEEEVLLEQDRFEFGTSFEGVLGAGVRWFASERFLVRADLGLYLWQLKAPEGFRDPARGFLGVGEKEWVSGPSFSLGAALHF
jgi:hypothetical protein